MNHRTSVAIAAVPLCVGLSLAAGPTYAGSRHANTAHTRNTSFAFKGSGFGTRIVGGQLPAGSQTTGYSVIGCTNVAGRSHANNVGASTLPGLGKATGVKTHVWTTFRHGVAASHSLHRVGRITLAQTALGSLSINAITSRARAYHDSTGFHATTTTHIGGLSFTPPIGPAQSFPLPTPDHPITIPGLVTIYAGQHKTTRSATGAVANAFALRIEVIPTGTSVRVAHSRAELDSGLTSGVFKGHSAATRVVSALDGNIQGGPNPLTTMPCQGTHGKTKEKSLATGSLGDQILFHNVNSRERGNQGAHGAHGMSRASVGQVSLGNQVLIAGIVGKVSVSRHRGHVTTSIKGTRLGSVTVSGQTQKFPKTGVLEIPGVVKLERAVVQRTHAGISVIGLRITLLDGTGAVINLGEAKLKITRLSH
jgi:hypothetical protein